MPQVRKRGPYGGLTDKEVEEWRTICNFHESFHGGAGSGESDALRDRLGHVARLAHERFVLKYDGPSSLFCRIDALSTKQAALIDHAQMLWSAPA